MTMIAEAFKEPKTVWQKPKRKHQDVDINTLSISDDPVSNRRYKEGKYDTLFNKLKYGQSIKCNSEDTQKIGNAMRDWAKRMNRKGHVKGISYYTKTTGRVFWLKDEPTKEQA